MNAKEHLQEVQKAQALHISNFITCLTTDPLADENDINYVNSRLEQYLWEVIDKDGDLASGIMVALECYLQK